MARPLMIPLTIIPEGGPSARYNLARLLEWMLNDGEFLQWIIQVEQQRYI